uniref:biotin--[acetyl-CoA-carboxylase] ligase n=1 Tax=Ignavigranum ruoffiae TaxID=89093 RepID=UPI0024ACCB21
IDSDNKLGYLLQVLNYDLDPLQLEAFFKLKYPKIHFLYQETVGSTNDIAKQYTVNQPNEEVLIISPKQLKGRGRRGRSFYSELDHGIYLSLVLEPNSENIEDLALYTLITATALAQTIERQVGGEVGIKWVNDIFYQGRKIAGILCETATDLETLSISSIIIGVGINLAGSFDQSEESVKNIAGTIFKELPEDFNVNRFIIDFIDTLLSYHGNFADTKYLFEYQKRLLGIGKKVYYEKNNQPFTGIIRGINNQGHLLIEDQDQKIKTLNSSEIHFSSQQFFESIKEK